MNFVWDEAKRPSNLAKHGFDFAEVEANFDWASVALTPAKLKRFKAVGLLKAEIVVLVFASLGSEALSLVSLRRASQRERNAYDGQTHEKL